MRISSKRKKKMVFIGNEILFLGPAVALFTLMLVISFASSIFYSFTEWNSITSATFVGLDNFRRMINDTLFWDSFLFTAGYATVSVIINNVLGITFALMITSIKRFSNFFRTSLFVPYAMSAFVLGFIWRFIFLEGFRTIGEATNIPFFLQPWMGTANTAFIAMVIMTVWRQVGFIMIIYIAGIMTIPTDVLESASVDGASPLQKTFLIKIPMLMQSITICLFLTIVWAFNVFDLNLSLTAGGPFNSTQSVSLNIYVEAFTFLNHGYATAKAFVFFVVVAIIGILQTKATSRKEVQL
jgi:raffinose/stachyose/melibiose transport system permease protein